MGLNPVVLEDMQWLACQDLPWDTLAGKTILISGAAGFLPAYMVELILWLNRGCNANNPTRVIGVVRNETKAKRRFKEYLCRSDLILVVQDVCAPLEISGPVDYVIHAASQASPTYYGTDPVGTLSANIFGTQRLLELAREKNSKRLMFFSSGEVYGAVSGTKPDENGYGYLDPLEVRSCYAESKRMGENMTISWRHQYGLSTVVVRPFHTYGPGMDLHDGRVFADFVADVVAGRDIIMKSDGSAVRAFCYLADAVAGFFTVLFRGEDGEAYNIGNDSAETSIIDLAELLAVLFRDRNITVRRQQLDNGSDYLQSPVNRICPDIAKARRLGWKPITGLSEGFNKTVRSFDLD